MSGILAFLSSIWRLFSEIQVPLLGISFADLWLGAFVVAFSISILRPLLGLGASGFNNIMTAGKRGYDKSYSKYRSNRERQEKYKKRYKEEHES